MCCRHDCDHALALERGNISKNVKTVLDSAVVLFMSGYQIKVQTRCAAHLPLALVESGIIRGLDLDLRMMES